LLISEPTKKWCWGYRESWSYEIFVH